MGEHASENASENECLIGVLAAIDEAVCTHPERRAEVAAVLPAYRDSQVAGWFRSFEAWVGQCISGDPALPSVEEALAALAGQASQNALSRRQQALTALAAAQPERFGRQGGDRDLVVEALRPLTPRNRRDQAEELHRRGTAGVAGAAPFQASLLMLPSTPGDDDPVSVLQTASPPLSGYDITQVEKLLEPHRWPDLSDFWESMTPVDDGAEPLPDGERRCFREVFVVTPSFKLQPVLEVVRRQLSGGPPARSLEYRLCSHVRHQDDGDLVIHDAGAIVSSEFDDALTVRTTKRVGFRGPFDGPALVMVAHALGYQDAFEDMIGRALELGTPTNGTQP